MQFRLVGVEYSSPPLSYDFREFAEHGLAPFSRCSFDIGSRFGERQTVACPTLSRLLAMSHSSKAVARAAQAVWKLRPDSVRGGRPARNREEYLNQNALMDLLLEQHALCF
jgi:hypothetical protein